jgi:tRNA(Ile)-lysidine synthase
VGPHPAVAQVRLGVRRCLSGAGLAAGDLVLAACSGGADSLALAAALAFEAPRLGLRAGGVTVDHGLQAGSAAQAAKVTTLMAELGLDPVCSLTAEVARPRGGLSGGVGGGVGAGYPGPEAAAREARYEALDRAAREAGAEAVVLGHTRDDQAETVLLGLARGSGTRSLAGMPERSGICLRPLLHVSRAQTRAACAALDLEPWDDPQNDDPAFTRARVRHRLLPALERELGPGVAEALARTARQLRVDAEFLDRLAAQEARRLAPGGPGLPLQEVAALPEAIRSRVLRDAAIAAGCPPGALTARHVAALDALATAWRGQRWTDLPGGIRGERRCGRLLLRQRGAPPTGLRSEGAAGDRATREGGGSSAPEARRRQGGRS